MDDRTMDPFALPASYAGSMFVSGTEGVKVTFTFEDRDEAEAWHEALTNAYDAAYANGDFDDETGDQHGQR